MDQKLDRVESWGLALATLIWVVVGCLGLFAPQILFQPTGLKLHGVAALAEIRAIYAGVFFMPAFVFARAVRVPARRENALRLLTLILGGYVLGRLVSIPLDGAPEGVGIPNLIAETAGLLACLYILRARARRALSGPPL